MKRLLICILLTGLVPGVLAETRFVTDQFKITMRSGQSTSHKVEHMLESGTQLDVLSTNPETGYSQVRTADGRTGFVLTRLLMNQPSARDRLQQAESRLAELQQEPEKLTSKLTALEQEYDTLKTGHTLLQEDNNALKQELESIQQTARDAVAIAKERDGLRKRMASLTRQAGELQLENQDLRNQSDKKWFLTGGGVLVGGILLGLILPRLRLRRRRDSWGSF
ncbi:MAG: TIGR04211 family SH3 domain-containing protein [Gammaproteobacteria bacterium]|nr:TIGR04211 family SH3 domain-containing protein [Gammaproteobacteria bacterium]